jgi:3-methylcrotonyl-CoA carboxylase alpha subunit
MSKGLFDTILIANRGEIAVRVMDTARKLGIKTVAVYSDADKNALHVRKADKAVYIGEAAAAQSYLVIEKVIAAAKQTGAQAIHPGYGFLSENASFARACKDNDIVFIGPSAEAIEAMGLKDKAKDLMVQANVPVVPGYQGENQDAAFLKEQAEQIGYPVLIKAVAGGGGKGMRRVDDAANFLDDLASCKREAKSSFSNDHVLIEKFIEKPRHIEVQVFGDNYGDAVYLFERDCSLQRRHQKVVEEAPAPHMPEAMRKAMGQAAVNAAKAISYSGAGTIEFIVDASGKELREDGFYFMEMNTRLQVEHPVTEAITGQDLVEWQIRVAAGEKLPKSQDDLAIKGHSVEVRLYAEDASNNFIPQTGRLSRFAIEGCDVRLDSGVETGDAISIHYDPMIAKLITHADTREVALSKMETALEKLRIEGLVTNQEFLLNTVKHPEFQAANLDTGFIATYEGGLLPSSYGLPDADDIALFISHLYYMPRKKDDPWRDNRYWRMGASAINREVVFKTADGLEHKLSSTLRENDFSFEWDGQTITQKPRCPFNLVFQTGYDVTLCNAGKVVHLKMKDYKADALAAAGEGRITSPMPGKVITVSVSKGQEVEAGQALLVMEAMKMEMTIKADCAGLIEDLPVANGDQVDAGDLLVSIEMAEGA